MSEIVYLFTDGACRGNPGPGGWGALIRYGEHEKRLHGGEVNTTNNRMEMMAAIKGLESLTPGSAVQLTTDSQYVMKGITEWMVNWKRRGWKTAARKPVLNTDLWKRLDAAVCEHTVDWKWVRGHTGHEGNEIADQLANQGVDEL